MQVSLKRPRVVRITHPGVGVLLICATVAVLLLAFSSSDSKRQLILPLHDASHPYTLAEKSYKAHAAHIGKEDRHVYDSDAAMKSYLDASVLDQQRHGYMLSASDSLVDDSPGSYWLTIGDLRFGSDALYLKRHGARIMATDLDDSRLKLASSRGYLTPAEFSSQNVESLTFPDNNFDYVLCKEAFHHFPRPMMGFYEMLRVAKRGVLIIEPQDVQDPVATATVMSSYHADGYVDRFEAVGNYVYAISAREIMKAAWSLKLGTVAVRGFNDHFVPDMTWQIFKDRVDYLNKLGYSGERQFNLVAIIVFKQTPSFELLENLKRSNFSVVTCPNDCKTP